MLAALRPNEVLMSDHAGPNVFDFDDTLIHGESTGCWLRVQLRASWWRKALVLLLAPLWGLQMQFARSRKRGVSLLLWATTLGYSPGRLQRSFDAFAQAFRNGQTPLRWHEAVCAELDAGLRRGERAVVVTAAPQALAAALLRTRWPRLAVLGSTLRQFRRGWVGEVYCRGAVKLEVLARKGYLPPFTSAYSDSIVDLPLFENARTRIFVGTDAASLRELDRRGLTPERRL